MLFLSRDPRTAVLVPAEAAEAYRWFLESADPKAARLAAWAGGHALPRGLAYAAETFVIPGIMLHYAVRKLFLEDAVRAALTTSSGDSGILQVVVLGAGLGTLALRLHRERPDVRFFECDHPATQRFKRQAFAAHRRLCWPSGGEPPVCARLPAFSGPAE
ncbi:MAG TPA: class I SAM-dependent methyltransferase [Thermoanaerobaculia bacterium]|nr:class I SAM-dependent methyltransferase [Thermoanaerobaculia bacterium]